MGRPSKSITCALVLIVLGLHLADLFCAHEFAADGDT